MVREGYHGGGLRPSAVAILVAALIACTDQAAVPPSPTPFAEGQTQAADLRTRLDLLLGEHVMIVAKESAAAVNRSDEYPAYTALLTTNASDLANVFGSAFGRTAASQFSKSWSTQNGLLVDYAIGVVTHADDKASASVKGLTGTFATDFAQLLSSVSGVSQDTVTHLVREQVVDDKAFIDDVFTSRYPPYYADLHTAYTHTARLGDVLASQIARKFPDRFPGDPTLLGADLRVSFNLLLQEHAYTSTMATDSTVAQRADEKAAAQAALKSGAGLLSAALGRLYDTGASAELDRLWAVRDKMLMDYASGFDPAPDNLTNGFVSMFAYAAHVDRLHVLLQVQATVKVIDDQKARSSKTLAGDDRAAATAMQPIADSLQG